MFQQGTFNTGEVTLSFAETSKTASPLLFLHGLTGRWQEYIPLIQTFTPDWHVYAYDLRGHGTSGWVSDHYDLTNHTADASAFLDQQIGESAVIVGHSLGAAIAMMTAAQQPHLVKALILLDPPLCVREITIDAQPELQQWFSWIHHVTTTQQSFEAICEDCRQMMPEADDFTIQELAESIVSLDPDTLNIVFGEPMFENTMLAVLLSQISCPTLLLHGDWKNGSVVRNEDANFVRQYLDNVEIAKITGGSHMFHAEQQTIVSDHIQAFLKNSSENL